MNAREDVAPKTAHILWIIDVILALTGIIVIYCWHHPSLFPQFHSGIIAMAYETAICLLLLALALGALLGKHFKWTLVFSSLAGAISLIPLVQFFVTGNVFKGWLFDVHFTAGGTMSAATSSCLLLSAISIFLIGAYRLVNKNLPLIVSAFINVAVLTLALIALLSQAAGTTREFAWLGIGMPPQTAACLCMLALALSTYINKFLLTILNHLKFFHRIAIGFAIMGLLTLVIGAAALMQINSVSDITQEIYKKPIQVSNASLRARSSFGNIIRQLKNIAIQPENANCQALQPDMKATETKVLGELAFIQQLQPESAVELNKLIVNFTDWNQSAIDACKLLDENNAEQFSTEVLNEIQNQGLNIIATLDTINQEAQQKITNLTRSAEEIENEAQKLIVVVALGFLIVGVIVASFITRSLTDQLDQIRKTMLEIAQGSPVEEIPLLGQGEEIGDMAHALNIFKESVAGRLELETRLLSVIEAMPNGIILVNNSGIIEIVNTQAEAIFGYQRSELLGKSVEQLLPAKVAGKHPAFRDGYFKNPSPRAMGTGRELFGLRRDGSEFPLEIGLAPVNTSDGLKVLASIVDITERRNAEIALNRSRERLELTTRINQIGVWEYIVDEDKLIWDETMFAIYGRNKDLFSADYKAWKLCVHPADLERTEKFLQDAITSLTPFDAKFRIIQPDGSIKYLHAKAKIERMDDNKRLRLLGTNIDITREETAYAKLHNLEALRAAIVEYSEDAIISKTPLGIITSWNTGARNMFGYTAEEVLGKPIKDILYPPELAHQEDALLAQASAGIVVKHFETLRRCKDGRLLNISITISPIKDANGNIVGVSAINRDITESVTNARTLESRKKELEYANRELERSNKELETFAYVASHDLKSPLRGIAQLSSWIEEDLETRDIEEVKQHTHMLRNRIQRMEKLLDDLLIFYRAGKADGEIKRVNLHQMATDLFEIQNNKPGLRLDIPTPLPEIETLSTPLEQIIRNLLSNAIKHHDKSEGVVQVSSRDQDDFYEISVCDDGPGIAEKYHQRIFGMFQTLKPRDELEGSGMGLALIKKLVENYGGKIQVKSEGRGTCFVFTWPHTITSSHHGLPK